VKDINKEHDDIDNDDSYFITTDDIGEKFATEWNPELRLVKKKKKKKKKTSTTQREADFFFPIWQKRTRNKNRKKVPCSIWKGGSKKKE
jgi:hypothetical protein